MLENINIDTIMRDYYSSICADKLSEDNINIDENLSVENSAQKYLIEFANFLNESYYKGYYISESIMKKLMDIINYEDLEYQILLSYIDILNNAMKDTKWNEASRPNIDERLSPEDSKDFIMKYLEVLQNPQYPKHSTSIPHYTSSQKSFEKENTGYLSELKEELYPIDVMYKAIARDNIIRYDEAYAEHMKVIFDNNYSAYKSILSIYKNKELGCFFLLDNTDNKSLDILVENITSLDSLLKLIKIYNKFGNFNFKFNQIANDNIRRLIELITINVSIEQTAMIISKDYDDWRLYCDENYHKLDTLLMALNLYQSDPEKFRMIDPVTYIKRLKEYYPDDIYFYARNSLLSMSYKLLCDNFIDIYNSLKDSVEYTVLNNLFNECFDGLISLRNKYVDEELINLHNKINELNNSINNKSIVIYENNELKTELINFDYKDIIDIYLKEFNLKYKLLTRNGEFDTNLVPNENSDVMAVYKYTHIDDSINSQNIYYDQNNKITLGTKINEVAVVESMDPLINILDEYFDASFRKCDKDNAIYIAKYIDIKDVKEHSIDILLVYGDKNYKLKIKTPTIKMKGKYLVGLIDISDNYSFIYANNLPIKDDNIEISKLYNYYNQIKCNINAAEKMIIELERCDKSIYNSIDNKGLEYVNCRVILSSDYDNESDSKVENIVLL